jgi:hypothetical protein
VFNLPATQSYRNRNGVQFAILVERAVKIPPNASYWGFLFRVSVEGDTDTKRRLFRALLKKEFFSTEEGAAHFVMGDPLRHLKHAYLDHYEDGHTPVLWPDTSGEWAIF